MLLAGGGELPMIDYDGAYGDLLWLRQSWFTLQRQLRTLWMRANLCWDRLQAISLSIEYGCYIYLYIPEYGKLEVA